MSSDETGHPVKPPPLAERIAPEVARLAGQGIGRNEISRRLKVAPSLVTKAAGIAGVTFDNSVTEAATTARARQAEQARAGLAVEWVEIAELAVRRVRVELQAELLDPVVLRAVATTAGIATDKSVLLSSSLPTEVENHGMSVANDFMQAIDSQILEAAFTEDPTNPQEIQ